ncbi:MAG: hypothetical protein M1587_02405, partial [Thaumarchaeota archaeon]|nr:hypothetical protein [Nitrososphaerota archaeon]
TMAEIMKLGSALDLFLAKWVASKNTGSDAIQGELDLELLDTGTLNMDLFGKIMRRLKNLDIALLAVGSSDDYLDDFERKCIATNRSAPSASISNMRSLSNKVRDHLLDERQRFANLVDRCNMYFQSKTSQQISSSSRNIEKLTVILIVMTIWVAFIALTSFAFDIERTFPLSNEAWQFVLVAILVSAALAGIGSVYLVLKPQSIITHE